jgi:hyaluronan synthase
MNKLWNKYGKRLILILTLMALFPFLIMRTDDFTLSLTWVYSILMLFYLYFMYSQDYRYKPMDDVGYRPNITVIIPCKNEEAVIARTIQSVIDSDYPTDKLNIVAIDDGSTDGTYKIMKLFESDRVKILHHIKNKGKRQAFATGFRATESDLVICVDSDTTVAKDAIRLLVQPFIDDLVVATCGHGEAANIDKNLLTKVQHYWYQDMFTLVKRMESTMTVVTCCSGILAAYRRNIVSEVLEEFLTEKCFGNDILYGDDRRLTNLSARGACGISTRDAKVKYQSNAIAYTMVPDNFRTLIKQQIRWKRSWLHGFKLAQTFMWRKKFPIPIYFYISTLSNFAAPVILVLCFVIIPLSGHTKGPIVFLTSIFFIACLRGLNTWNLGDGEKSKVLDFVIYRLLFEPYALVQSVTILPYAWGTFWRGGWMTRTEDAAEVKADE